MKSINFDRMQFLFVFVFVVVNALILLGAQAKIEDGTLYHPTYWNASDGQRYWGVAINLAEKGQFTIPAYLSEKWKSTNPAGVDEPLRRAGPVPALIFSVPIKLFGLERASIWIVGFQCLLLFAAGLLARELCTPYRVNKSLIQALLIFNPNLISLAHHAQSDLIFTFLIVVSLVLVTRIFVKPYGLSMTHSALLGVTVGLLPLTRPLGLYYVVFLLAYLFVILIRDRGEISSPGYGIRVQFIVISIVIGMLVTLPWGLRNKIVLDHFGVTYSEGIMMKWHYDALQDYRRTKDKEKWEGYYLEKHGVTDNCIGDVNCKRRVFNAYLDGILDTPTVEIGRALAISWAKLFVSGGISQLTRYLGVDTPLAYAFLESSQSVLGDTINLISKLIKSYAQYLILFGIAVWFAFISRVLGILGIAVVLRNTVALRCTIFYLMCICLFLAIYLFSSIGRFRAPLEPILMLFTVIGITGVREAVGRYRKYKSK